MKCCPRCGLEKPLDDFALTAKGRPRGYCRPCTNEYQGIWRRNNRKAAALYARKGQLRRNYGLTLEGYAKMLDDQGGACAICGATSPGDNSQYFHVDHDHATSKVRALLCGLCNKGLGCFRDDLNLLAEAQTYLGFHRQRHYMEAS